MEAKKGHHNLNIINNCLYFTFRFPGFSLLESDQCGPILAICQSVDISMLKKLPCWQHTYGFNTI